MDTSDEWIVERTGIKERRWVSKDETSAAMALSASSAALERAGMEAGEIDAIVLATLSPDHFFPGTGVFLQRELGLAGVPALDIRAQCTGFLYGLSVADAWIKSGQYRTILLVGVEIQSTGIDVTTRGRDMAVLFGDGAGAAVLGATEEKDRGVLSTHRDRRFKGPCPSAVPSLSEPRHPRNLPLRGCAQGEVHAHRSSMQGSDERMCGWARDAERTRPRVRDGGSVE